MIMSLTYLSPRRSPDHALDKGGVFFARARAVRVSTRPPGLEFTVDGEVIGDEPAEFAVVPRALKVIVGPGYRMGYDESA